MLDEDEGAPKPIPDPAIALGITVGNPAKEVRRTVAEAFKERPDEESGVGGDEDVDHTHSSKC